MEAIWVIICAAGALTFAVRLSFFLLWQHWQPPEVLTRALRYVPPAVLTAIIFPELFMRQGQLVLSPLANPRLGAGLIAALVAWRTRSVLLTIAIGMIVLYLLDYLF